MNVFFEKENVEILLGFAVTKFPVSCAHINIFWAAVENEKDKSSLTEFSVLRITHRRCFRQRASETEAPDVLVFYM